MAFTHEQHNFVSVLDPKCIRERGFSAEEQDWTLVYYPGRSGFTYMKSPKIRKVNYPASAGFGDVVHWLDAAYAEDTQQWSKHTHICLTSHAMNILILFTEDGDDPSDLNENINKVFRQAISRVTSLYNLSIVPVVYPLQKGEVNQKRRFGDETELLEDVLGLSGTESGKMLLEHLP